MWLDITEYWTLWIMLCYGLASFQGVRAVCESCMENVTLSAQRNTEVLLPCAFPAHPSDPAVGSEHEKVLWSQSSKGPLLDITRTGRVNFSDPREGRVKVFPNLCRLGNCSIRIERLQPSDLGEYCCVLRNRSSCSVLKFSANKADEQDKVRFMGNEWFAIGGGVGGIFLLLLITCFSCVKFRKRDDVLVDHTNMSTQQGSDAEEIVYENDDHDPDSIARVEMKPQQENDHDPNSIARVEMKQQKEITSSSSQQPNAVKPFYANQGEIDRQLEKRKKQKNRKLQYENPIYANSNEQLDRV